MSHGRIAGGRARTCLGAPSRAQTSDHGGRFFGSQLVRVAGDHHQNRFYRSRPVPTRWGGPIVLVFALQAVLRGGRVPSLLGAGEKPLWPLNKHLAWFRNAMGREKVTAGGLAFLCRAGAYLVQGAVIRARARYRPPSLGRFPPRLWPVGLPRPFFLRGLSSLGYSARARIGPHSFRRDAGERSGQGSRCSRTGRRSRRALKKWRRS